MDPEILMHENVPEANNVRPRNRRVLLYQFRTEPRSCLADKRIFRPPLDCHCHPVQSVDDISLWQSRRIDRLSLGEHLWPDERLQGRLDG